MLLTAYQHWGVGCLERLQGMFAFCLYDHRLRRMFLARDRAGEKPLFYWRTNRQFCFASELKALMTHPAFPRQLNVVALEFYLTYGYVPGAMCLLQHVSKLPQGHAMTYDVDTDHLQVWQYWELPDADADCQSDPEQLVDELYALLEESVRRQLVADVPVGILLSGGVDSGLITAMAARVSPQPVHTFTISFPGHTGYDELPFAQMVADHFSTRHTVLEAEPSSVDLLPRLAEQYDEPIGDSSMVPTYLVAQLVRRHCTVALGGDGGDELFGGYFHHSWLQRMASLRQWLSPQVRALLRRPVDSLLPLGMKGRNYLLALTSDMPGSIAQFNLFFDASSRTRLLATALGRQISVAPENYKIDLCRRFETPLQRYGDRLHDISCGRHSGKSRPGKYVDVT